VAERILFLLALKNMKPSGRKTGVVRAPGSQAQHLVARISAEHIFAHVHNLREHADMLAIGNGGNFFRVKNPSTIVIASWKIIESFLDVGNSLARKIARALGPDAFYKTQRRIKLQRIRCTGFFGLRSSYSLWACVRRLRLPVFFQSWRGLGARPRKSFL